MFCSLQSHQYQCNLRRGSGSIRYKREQQRQQAPKQHHCELSQSSSNHSPLSSYKKLLDHAASAHEYAQKLNNVSAVWIEIGRHDKAIENLDKAMRLSKFHTTDQLLDQSESFNCQYCSLNGCIQHSEEIDSNNPSNLKKNNRKKSVIDIEEDTSTPASTTTMYLKPIRIPERAIQEGHNMGSNLFLIITFNLAVAHHLKALKKKTSSSSSSLLNTTARLYEIANNWQQHLRKSNYVIDENHDDESFEDDDDDEDDTSLSAFSMHEVNTYSTRFNTILYNNLNHLIQLIMMNNISDNNNDDGVLQTTRSSSKRSLDDLLSADVVVTPLDANNNKEQQPQKFSEQSLHTPVARRVSHYDDEKLKFQCYSDSEEDEYFDQQQVKRLRYV